MELVGRRDGRVDDASDCGASRLGRRLSCLAVVVAVFAVGTGDLVRLFQDELLHPFGDARACEGSDTKLPQVISAGGVPIPADASDIHYVTKNGSAQVSFLSSQVPDCLHRAGRVPEGEFLSGKTYGSAFVLGPDDGELPEGLCGSALKGPAWSYYRTRPDTGVGILVEQSSTGYNDFRTPARVIATFDIR